MFILYEYSVCACVHPGVCYRQYLSVSRPAAVIALFCRQYDIIKDNDSSNSKEKAKPSSDHSTPEHHSGGLLRSKVGPADARLPRLMMLC